MIYRGPSGNLGFEFERPADKPDDPYVITSITLQVGPAVDSQRHCTVDRQCSVGQPSWPGGSDRRDLNALQPFSRAI